MPIERKLLNFINKKIKLSVYCFKPLPSLVPPSTSVLFYALPFIIMYALPLFPL